MKILKIAVLTLFLSSVSAVSNIDSVQKWGWGENIGWVNFNPTGGDVEVSATHMTGSLWSQNYGWIHLQPSKSGVRVKNVVAAAGECTATLGGQAWGGQLGWVDFDNSTISTDGVFGGYLSGNISGQISLVGSNLGVKTSWMPDCSPVILSPEDGASVGNPILMKLVCYNVGEVINISNSSIIPDPTSVTCSQEHVDNGFVAASIPLDPVAQGTAQTLILNVNRGGVVSQDKEISLIFNDGDNISTEVEELAQNNGDGDGDGVSDFLQKEVASLPNKVKSSYNSLRIPTDSSCEQITHFSSHIETDFAEDSEGDYPLGLWKFELECGSAGETVDVTIYLDQVYDTSGWVYKKYNETLLTYTDISSYVTYSVENVKGVERTAIRYQVTDGGDLDEDGLVNGSISDPSGPSMSLEVVEPPVIVPTYPSGGGVIKRDIISVCSKEIQQCLSVYPTKAKGEEAYNTYKECRSNGVALNNCLEEWISLVGYEKCSDQCTIKESLVEVEKPKVVVIDKTVRASAGCTEITYNRFPEKRGKGVSSEYFRDVSRSHPGRPYLIDLGEQKIIHGDEGTFYARLDDPINRAEFVKIMTIARQDTLKQGDCAKVSQFPDVNKDQWFNEFVENMESSNIVHGYDDGYYRPSRNINLSEAYKILALSFGYITKAEADYVELNEEIEWYVPYYEVLLLKGVIPEILEGEHPKKELTRGESFSFLSSVLYDVDGYTPEEIIRNPQY